VADRWNGVPRPESCVEPVLLFVFESLGFVMRPSYATSYGVVPTTVCELSCGLA